MDKDNEIKVRRVTAEVKGLKITFDEYYKVDSKTGEEVFDRELEIKNDANLYDIYKKQKGLLTNEEIKSIRNKYEMNQKEYAFAIGVGEVTVNRFENGAIQTEATDAIMRLSEDPNNMYNLLVKNKDNMPENLYEKFLKRVIELKKLDSHKIANYDEEIIYKVDFQTADIEDVSDNIIEKYNKQYKLLNEQYDIETNCEFITPLQLQKLLYYVQGMALCIYKKPAFTNKIYAWPYGPVIEEVYKKYKSKGKKAIDTPKKVNELSEGLNYIIDIVIEGYGKYNAGSLIELTHEEEPWKNTEINMEITQESIKNYFERVYGDVLF